MSGVVLTDARVQALADLACATRPTGAPRWDPPGVVTGIRRLMDKGFGAQEVIDRVFAHAWDASAKTPGTLLTPKRREPEVTSPHPFPLGSRDRNECPVHPGQAAGVCSFCASDALVGTTTPPPARRDPGRRVNVRELVLEHAPHPEHFKGKPRETAQTTDTTEETA